MDKKPPDNDKQIRFEVKFDFNRLKETSNEIRMLAPKVIPKAIVGIANETRNELIRQLDNWVYNKNIRRMLNKRIYYLPSGREKVPTGRLRQSIMINYAPNKMSATVGTNVKYARKLEFGLYGVKPRQFAQRTQEIMTYKTPVIATKILNEQIDKFMKGKI